MNNKTLSIVSYITLIGWLIAYFSGKKNADSLLKYHLRQALGLFITALAYNLVFFALVYFLPETVGAILGKLSYVFWALPIFGIINAANEAEKPLLIIGKMFENKFSFIG